MEGYEATTKVSFSEFVDLCVFMRFGESLRLSEILTFDECTWCISCIHDAFSNTNKLLITHDKESENYPSTVLDIPTAATINTWVIWFEHILRIKGLLSSDKNVFINESDLKKVLYIDAVAV